MRIKINSGGRKFNLRIPTRLFFNPISAAICKGAVTIGRTSFDNNNINLSSLSYRDIRKLFKIIRMSRILLDGEPLISACSANGEIVEIWL